MHQRRTSHPPAPAHTVQVYNGMPRHKARAAPHPHQSGSRWPLRNSSNTTRSMASRAAPHQAAVSNTTPSIEHSCHPQHMTNNNISKYQAVIRYRRPAVQPGGHINLQHPSRPNTCFRSASKEGRPEFLQTHQIRGCCPLGSTEPKWLLLQPPKRRGGSQPPGPVECNVRMGRGFGSGPPRPMRYPQVLESWVHGANKLGNTGRRRQTDSKALRPQGSGKQPSTIAPTTAHKSKHTRIHTDTQPHTN